MFCTYGFMGLDTREVDVVDSSGRGMDEGQ